MARFRRSRLLVVGAVGGAVVAAAIAFAAGALGGGAAVPTWTGCLNTSSGTISKVQQGDQPMKACGDDTTISFAPGDITSVAAGAGLTGGGDNGDVELGVDPKYSLPQTCSDGQFAQWSADAWVCGQYTNGTGLNLSGTQFSVDPSYQLPQSCSSGQVPNRTGGGWSCVSVARASQSCPDGQFATVLGSDGSLGRAAPATHDPEAWVTRVRFANAPHGSSPEVAKLTLPAGAFLVDVAGTAKDDDNGDDEISVFCDMPENGAFVKRLWADIGEADSDGDGPAAQIAATDVVDYPGGGTVSLDCGSLDKEDHVQDLGITAVRVGTVHVQ